MRAVFRRVLLFLLFLAGGSAILTIVVGPENIFNLDPTPNDDRREGLSGGVKIETGSKKGGGKEGPQSVSIELEGKLDYLTKEQPVRTSTGEIRMLRIYKIEWKDAQQRIDRSYNLSDVVVTFYQRVGKGEELRAEPAVVLEAQSMNVAFAEKGQILQIDETHEILARKVKIIGSASGLVTRNGARTPLRVDDALVTIETDRMRSRFDKDRIFLENTNPNELVDLFYESKDLPLHVTGHGLTADFPVDLKSASGERRPRAAKARSILRLDHDVTIRGLAAKPGTPLRGSAEFWRVTGSGALRLGQTDAMGLSLDLSDDVRFVGWPTAKAYESQSGSPVTATGKHLLATLRRGRLEDLSGDVELLEPSLQDIRMRGTEGQPAELLVSGQLLRAGELDLFLGPLGRVESMEAVDAPELLFRYTPQSAGGNAAARRILVRAERSIVWRRPQGVVRPLLGALGLDQIFDGLSASGLGPEERILFEGPTQILPLDAPRASTRLRADRGLLVHLGRGVEGLEPYLLRGFGATEFRIAQEGLDLLATGSEGFHLVRTPGASQLDFVLGPRRKNGQNEAGHAFRIETESERISGLGYVHMTGRSTGWASASGDVATALAGSELPFRIEVLADPGTSVQVTGTRGATPTVVRGVETVEVLGKAQNWERLVLTGKELQLRGASFDAKGTRLERSGRGPWELSSNKGLVELRRLATGGTSAASEQDLLSGRLSARRLLVFSRPRPWPFAEGATQLLLALQDVGLKSSDASRGRRTSLECDSLLQVPELVSPMHEVFARSLLGPAMYVLHPLLLGSGDRLQVDRELKGIWLADGAVKFRLDEEVPGEQGRVRRRSFRGEHLDLLADLSGSRLLPGPGGMVTASVIEPERGELHLSGASLVTRGVELALGGASPRVIFIGKATGDAPRPRLLVDASGPVSVRGRRLSFPGPVVANAVDASGVPVPGGFWLRCQHSLELHSKETLDDLAIRARRKPREKAASGDAGSGLPSVLERFVAHGAVTMGYGQVTAKGAKLDFDLTSKWLTLEGTRQLPVVVEMGESAVFETWPKMAIQVETLELKSGPGRFIRRRDGIRSAAWSGSGR